MKRKFTPPRRKKINGFERFRLHHKIIFLLIGTVGTVSIWRGIWTLFDQTPVLSHPLALILIGFILVLVSGVFFKLL